MAGKSIINVLINGDTRGLTGALNDAGGRITSFATTAAKRFAVFSTALAGVATVVGKKAIDAASDLQEVTSKTDVIFGDASAAVKDFAAQAALSLGQSQTAALDAATTFGTFGKAAGLTGPYLANFSTDLTGLASDLASFANTTPEEAALALGAALRGESEPIRKYGVLLDDATLKARAATLGIYDGNGALNAQQKILAAQAEIFAQTADAQGDFARTSGGVANQQRILAAQFENVKARLGTALLPAFSSVLGFITDKVVPGVEKLIDVFQADGLGGIVDVVKGYLPKLKETLAGWGQALIDWIGPRIGPALRKLQEWGGRLFGWLVDTGVPFLLEKLQQLGQALVDWIGPRIRPALEQLGQWLAQLGNWIVDVGLPTLVDKLIALGQALVDWIGPRIAPALQELGKLIGRLAEWLVTVAVPKIAAQAVKLGGALLSWLVDLVPKAVSGLANAIGELVKRLPGLFLSLIVTMGNIGADIARSLIDKLVAGLKTLAVKGLDVGKSFANAIIGFINRNVIAKINDALDFTIPIPYGPDIRINPPDIPSIPMLAAGGIVTRPTLAVVGEAGPEAVIPLRDKDRMGSHTTNLNVSVTAGMGANGTEIGQAIVRELVKFQRRNGPLPLRVAS
jgi:hypothetical protein